MSNQHEPVAEAFLEASKGAALWHRRAWCLGAAWLLAACTTPAIYTPQQGLWRGRLALNTEEERPRSYTASFELKGSQTQGELEVYNPLGNVLAKLIWSSQQAMVDTGSERLVSDSLDELVAHIFGTPIPVQALFAWLQGDAQQVAGWQLDLSRYSEGRISALREQPLPRTSLRVILQSPEDEG
ncbi:hypothetical protein E9531_11230 [Lampropedia puyangensis]|uniref:Outer-membrane lipoprotein LolB n=1 Tax=Lampropedia puyangensis TaxID=1330072 RepID=A0A4S8EZV3_9BURK|nr:lipoprotein insertase outer membrane protein LolB [Lampropedia puyangensis]THT99900.1 hypothetical protein E9531_11230 [Lampropedia puyangensis]